MNNAGGDLIALNGGILQIGNTTIQNGGTGVIAAALQNAKVILGTGAAIQGGVLASSAGGFEVIGSSELDGTANPVINAATVKVQGSGNLGVAGSIDNIGQLSFEGAGNLQVVADATLSGTGNIVFASGGAQTRLIDFSAGTTLTNTGNTISASNVTINIAGRLVNRQGTMEALGGGEFNFMHDSSNAGVMEAAASVNTGAVIGLNVGGSTQLNFTNTGTMLAFAPDSAETSAIAIKNTALANPGGTILSYGAGAEILLTNSTVTGGTVRSDAGGYIDCFGTGSVSIQTTMQNYGALGVTSPTTISGSLLGSGSVSIQSTLHVVGDFSGGGSATFNPASAPTVFSVDGAVGSGKVAFTSSSQTETLNLGHTKQFAGYIDGFHTASTAQLDLTDVANAQVTWVQVAGGANPFGYLLVNGGNSGALLMLGSFVQGNFHTAPDGASGTMVTDPPVSPDGAISSATTQQLVQSMASFGAGSSATGGSCASAPASSPPAQDWLAAPAGHG